MTKATASFMISGIKTLENPLFSVETEEDDA
jgi:hypothetical protein